MGECWAGEGVVCILYSVNVTAAVNINSVCGNKYHQWC